jgi:hypothetical protein
MLFYCYHWYVVWLGDFYKHLEVALVARIHQLRHWAKVYTTCQYKNCGEPQANNPPNISLNGCGDLNCGCGALWPASKQPLSFSCEKF